MTASITRLTLSLGLLGAPAIAAAAEATDEITVQVIGEEGAKGIARQIQLPAQARERKAAPSADAVGDQREAISEHRRQLEDQAREQRTDAAGGGRAAGGR